MTKLSVEEVEAIKLRAQDLSPNSEGTVLAQDVIELCDAWLFLKQHNWAWYFQGTLSMLPGTPGEIVCIRKETP